jgi:hypothetical protein
MLRHIYYASVHKAIQDGLIKHIEPGQLPPFLQKQNGNLRLTKVAAYGSDGDGFSRWNMTIAILPPGTEYISPKSS